MAFDQAILLAHAAKVNCPFHGVIGVDEVGRGSLVGPVMAAAYCFHPEVIVSDWPLLNILDDSKAAHFTHVKRLALSEVLKQTGYWAIAEATQEEVESLNVVQASLLAAARAVQSLEAMIEASKRPSTLLIMDGNLRIPNLAFEQVAVVKADQQSAAVAAASVLAKAYRDSLMIDFAQHYPGYSWEKNAGYPTPAHKAAIASLGVSPLHRKTYKTVQSFLALKMVETV